MPSDVKAHIRITGCVQGVGYRDFTQQAASQLKLRGYVRNLWNGDVEVVAEGPRNLIVRLMENLRQGPAMAQVDKLYITWQEATGAFQNFGIKR